MLSVPPEDIPPLAPVATASATILRSAMVSACSSAPRPSALSRRSVLRAKDPLPLCAVVSGRTAVRVEQNHADIEMVERLADCIVVGPKLKDLTVELERTADVSRNRAEKGDVLGPEGATLLGFEELR